MMMKKVMPLVLILATATVCTGEVFPQVYLADSNTPLSLRGPNIPFVYRDIMVGTRLTIIIYSNVAEYWSGSLTIADANMDLGVLSARRPQNDGDWKGSHLLAAGKEAAVYDWEEAGIDGFDLYTGSTGIQAGDWFIIDYNAINIGTCTVGFYDYGISWDQPIYYLKFSHVRTQDFNKDTRVDFTDFAIFASRWQENECGDPDWCEGTDLDTSGTVDTNDLMSFAEYWLEKTE
jgi:hypothetical protein